MYRGSKNDFSVAILAGGESSRMGRNKALEPLGGKPVIAHVIDSLKPFARDIFIVAGDVDSYVRFGLPVCADQYGFRSSIVGVYSALADSRHEHCFTVACDMPFVEPALVGLLTSLAPGRDAVVPVSARGREPLHAVYSRACLEPMRERIEAGDLALGDLLDSLDVRYVELPELEFCCDPAMVFINVNTIVDLEEASTLVPRFEKQRGRGLPNLATRRQPPLVCFVGKKNSGKTTFLEKLTLLLKSRGLNVAFIKHDVHGFEMDSMGTDTWRLTQAGAREVAISSPEAFATIRRVDHEVDLDEIYNGIGRGVDIVIAEGFKSSAMDKIEISRSQRSTALVCEEDDLLAVISDRPDAAATVPVFDVEDVEGIAMFLIGRYRLDAGEVKK